MINRNEKRKIIVQKYATKRHDIKLAIQKNKENAEMVFKLSQELALLPRASSSTRVSNRCFITGRARGVYRRFGLCRNELRRLASFSDITGVKKSSW
ncbi:MAG: small subunit ribosomal protein S14 [Alphaproteobacteria bacterium]|jgi:small subunit ribosomal protein S14